MGRKRKILLDTNAVVYFLEGREEFETLGNYSTFYYSFITEIELLSFGDEERRKTISGFLKNGKRVGMDNKIIAGTIEVRKTKRLKVPDAIIVASAKKIKADLFTSDEEIIRKVDDLAIINLLKK
ncbi:MAG: type II toxin-antitoxin system VapC family toxin [bacterium]|nr:type II toxin-antitoxin system VapC family toxin [bacterium]